MTSTLGTPGREAVGERSAGRDITEILYAPASLFARRTEGRYGPPALILTVAFVLLALISLKVLAPLHDAEFARGLAQMRAIDPEFSTEDLEAMRSSYSLSLITRAAFLIPFTALAVGAAIHLFGAVLGATTTLKFSIMIAVYAQFPRLVQRIVHLVQGLLLPSDSITSQLSISTGPARLLDLGTASPIDMVIAERFDPFTIWATFIIAVGLQVIGGLPRRRAYLAAAMVWLAGALPAALTAPITG